MDDNFEAWRRETRDLGLREVVVRDDIDECIAGRFHRWHERQWTVPPAVTVGGAPGGQMSGMLAVVEYINGRVDLVDAERIRFVDAKGGE